jgi:hypothetical protein
VSDQERDPRPVGDYDVDDQASEVTNHPDNARADDVSVVAEPEEGERAD